MLCTRHRDIAQSRKTRPASRPSSLETKAISRVVQVSGDVKKKKKSRKFLQTFDTLRAEESERERERDRERGRI